MRIVLLSLTLIGLNENAHAQKDFELILRASEVLVTGYTALKANPTYGNTSASCCVKNKLSQRILFRMVAQDELTEKYLFKEILVLPNQTECMLDLEPRLYTYEVRLLNGEIHKKGDVIVNRKMHFRIKP